MLTNQEKKELLQDKIRLLDFMIENLSLGIANSPDADIPGKRPRAEVLQEKQTERQFYIETIQNLE
jgi:hypothetical protein